MPQRTLSDHSAKMPELANPLNSDLIKGFTVPQVAHKHGWTEPMVWAQALWQPCRKKRSLGLSAGM